MAHSLHKSFLRASRARDTTTMLEFVKNNTSIAGLELQHEELRLFEWMPKAQVISDLALHILCFWIIKERESSP